MVIYWDLVILTNLIIDYAFLKTIAVIYKEKIKWYRMIISLILGIVSLLLFLLPIKYLYNFRYVMGIFMGMIAYKTKEKLKRFLMIISYYIINILFIGNLVIFEIKSFSLLLLIMIYVIILTMIEKILSKQILKMRKYKVVLKNIELNSLFDTGNKCCYQNRPVVFLDNKWYTDEFVLMGEMEISTISSKQIIKIYQGVDLMINNHKEEVYYSFSNINKYDIILNNKIGE